MYIALKINFAIMCYIHLKLTKTSTVSSLRIRAGRSAKAYSPIGMPKKKGHPVKELGTIKALQSADNAACAALGAMYWAGSGGAGGSACFGKWRGPGAERGGLSAVGSAIGVSGLGSDICI